MCRQWQSITLSSDLSYVVVLDNVWQIDISQLYGSPLYIQSLRVQSQDQSIASATHLTLFNANREYLGAYGSTTENNGLSAFSNLPFVLVTILQIQFPIGTQSDTLSILLTFCPPESTASNGGLFYFYKNSPFHLSPIIVVDRDFLCERTMDSTATVLCFRVFTESTTIG